MSTRFVFQQSLIYDGSGRVNRAIGPVTVKLPLGVSYPIVLAAKALIG